MFDIHWVSSFNFRSYVGKHKFVFPVESGLYNLTGKNLAEPRLGTNGTGKTSLLALIEWVLTGRTFRGLKGGDVVTDGHKHCWGKVSLTVGDKRLLVRRSYVPNGLWLNKQPIDQDALTKALRLGAAEFNYSVILPQFNNSFFELSPAAKLTVFSDILKLDTWLEKSREADALAKEVLQTRIQKEQLLANRHGQVTTIVADIAALQKQHAEFEKSQQADMNVVKAKIRQSKEYIQSVGKEADDIRKVLLNLDGKEAKLKKEFEAFQTKAKKLSLEREGLVGRHVAANMYLERTRADLQSLEGLAAKCPTCRQTVDAQHIKFERAKLSAEFKKLKRTCDELKDELTDLDSEIGEERDREITRDLSVVAKNRADFERAMAGIQQRLFHAEGALQGLRDKSKNEAARVNPYSQQLVTKSATLEKLKAKISKIKLGIETLNEEHTALTYWIGGFKRIRLFIIEEVLQQLEIEVNNCLSSLGLTGWEVTFDVERENKSGGITRGFVVMIKAPKRKNKVKFEAWSGGETQRLILAGDLGLANLIMERAGLTNTIEFFDEPSEHLSPEGLLDLAETLHQRAITADKRIFLVDHNNLEFGDFKRTYVALKSAAGVSSIVDAREMAHNQR